MPLILSRNDITKVSTDAVVLPANEALLEGSGTSQAIFLAAGEEELAQACRRIGSCPTGSAVMTPGFKLPVKGIIHAVGPGWRGGNQGEADLLYSAYESSLRLAWEHGFTSIAFPLLSAGNYGFPKAVALNVANRAITDFLLEHDMDVQLVFYDSDSVAAGRQIFREIEEYIDDNYVGSRDEYYTRRGTVLRRDEVQIFGAPSAAGQWGEYEEAAREEYAAPSEKWEEYEEAFREECAAPAEKWEEDTLELPHEMAEEIREKSGEQEYRGQAYRGEAARGQAYREEAARGQAYRGEAAREQAYRDEAAKRIEESRPMASAYRAEWEEASKQEAPRQEASRKAALKKGAYHSSQMANVPAGKPRRGAGAPFGWEKKKGSLKDRIRELMKGESETFHEMLFRLIDESGMTYPQVYNRANMSKKLFSKIKLNPDSTPKKKNIIALAIALQLDMEQTEELLMKAGYALSNSSMADVIISYFIEKRNYDVFEINEALFEYGLENDLLGF